MHWKDQERLESALERRGVTRRAFLGSSVLGGAALAVGGAAVAPQPAQAGQTGSPSAPDVAPFELDEKTVADLQDAMESGQYTSEQITHLYLERIAATNNDGPRLRAVIETNPDALALAAALDQERQDHGPRGPLHGIPVLLKDNVATHDQMEATAGSLALVGSRPPRDAFLVAKLRAAGAVILGKANLSEWANFRGNASSSGWSARGGQCANPYVLNRNPCGSSSGSAAAVSANLAALTIGTETDGSIVCPSALCGVVGIKPSVGLVSRAGIIPIAHSQDTAGPICRTVADAATLLGALTGVDRRDPATRESAGHALTDYTSFLDPDGLRGKRIGVPRKFFFGYSPEADAVTDQALEIMRDAGAIIVDPADLPNSLRYFNTEFAVLLYEFKLDLNKYIAELGASSPVRDLAGVIAFNKAHADQELAFFGQEILEQAQADLISTAEYQQAIAADLLYSRKAGLDKAFAKFRLDALVAPTGSPAWITDHKNGDAFLGASSWPCAVAGYPNINVPAGFSGELPIGISFMGKRWGEGPLISIAYAFEQAAQARRVPKFLPSLHSESSFAPAATPSRASLAGL